VVHRLACREAGRIQVGCANLLDLGQASVQFLGFIRQSVLSGPGFFLL
jgi:hypothetical protein